MAKGTPVHAACVPILEPQAAHLFAHGPSQAEAARRLEVSRQAASRWHARRRQGGRAGLAGSGRWAARRGYQVINPAASARAGAVASGHPAAG